MINRSFSHQAYPAEDNQTNQSQYSLLSSIGKFFTRGQTAEEMDSIKELLGLTFEQFTQDETIWEKIVQLSIKLYGDKIYDQQIARLLQLYEEQQLDKTP